jgi:hypothetical protein
MAEGIAAAYKANAVVTLIASPDISTLATHIVRGATQSAGSATPSQYNRITSEREELYQRMRADLSTDLVV